MNDIHIDLLEILEDEITRATEKHGRLNSGHEVLLAECKEAAYTS